VENTQIIINQLQKHMDERLDKLESLLSATAEKVNNNTLLIGRIEE